MIIEKEASYNLLEFLDILPRFFSLMENLTVYLSLTFIVAYYFDFSNNLFSLLSQDYMFCYVISAIMMVFFFFFTLIAFFLFFYFSNLMLSKEIMVKETDLNRENIEKDVGLISYDILKIKKELEKNNIKFRYVLFLLLSYVLIPLFCNNFILFYDGKWTNYFLTCYGICILLFLCFLNFPVMLCSCLHAFINELDEVMENQKKQKIDTSSMKFKKDPNILLNKIKNKKRVRFAFWITQLFYK